MNYLNRRIQVKEFLNLTDADAFITNHRPSFMYLSGFTGSTGVLVITKNQDYLIVDGRYSLRARNEADQKIEIIDCLDKSSLFQKSMEILKNLNLKKIGIEKNNMKVSEFLLLSESFTIKPFNYLVENIRSQKEEPEIYKIKKALEISEIVLGEAQEKLYNGVGKLSELELANFIKNRIIELGATGIAFEPIVAFGKNTAYPHYSPSNSILQEGDFVIIDMGAVFDYYHSDITRSFCIGQNEDFKKLYSIVLEAQQKAIESVETGMNPVDIYNIAVSVFEKYNLADKFTHGLGHGVGLEIHELPSLSKGGFGILKNNNIITIEPGIYIPDLGGIRIEDMIMVKDSESIVLTKFPK